MMACIMPRPQRIILIRHGESQANVDRMLHAHTPDHRFALTEKGVQQAHEAGVKLYRELHKSPSGSVRIQFYLSPYVRTRQTYQGIMESMKELGVTDVLAYEDPRLREQEFGNYRHPDEHAVLDLERDEFGTFFYRVPGGESGADVFDRLSGAMDTMHRDFVKEDFPENMIVVSHGLTIRLFLMRWFHWTVEQFEKLRNPTNCQHYVLEKMANDKYRLITEMVTYTEAETAAYLAGKKQGTADMTYSDPTTRTENS